MLDSTDQEGQSRSQIWKKTNVSTSCNPDPNVFGLVPGLKDSSEEGPSMGQSIFFPNLEVSIYGPDN